MRALLLTAVLLTMSACTQGEGPVLDEAREVAAFTRIEAGSGIEVAVSIGSAHALVVHAQANIADSVRTEVRNGILVVEATDDFITDQPVRVDVVLPVLKGIALSGGSQLTAEGIDADALGVDLSGGSRATLTGSVGTLRLKARGGSIAALEGLASADASVTLDGAATVELSASETVSGSASGGATLAVAGGASVDVATSGGATVEDD